MTLSFALIGPPTSPNTQDLCAAAVQQGHTCTLYSIGEIGIDFSAIETHPFFQHDLYLFRGHNKSVGFAHTLALMLHRRGKVVIDSILTASHVRDKIQEIALLEQNNLPCPRTFYALRVAQWRVLLADATFPIVVKPLDGQKGQDVRKYDTFAEAMRFFEENERGFLAQTFIRSDGDVRVFIVGTTVLGAIKRFTVGDDFRSNASLGAKVEKYVLSSAIAEMALKAKDAVGYDIAGVDIIFDENSKPFILEVNHTPQWSAFKEATGINPAEDIINYALHCHEKKDRVL